MPIKGQCQAPCCFGTQPRTIDPLSVIAKHCTHGWVHLAISVSVYVCVPMSLLPNPPRLFCSGQPLYILLAIITVVISELLSVNRAVMQVHYAWLEGEWPWCGTGGGCGTAGHCTPSAHCQDLLTWQ